MQNYFGDNTFVEILADLTTKFCFTHPYSFTTYSRILAESELVLIAMFIPPYFRRLNIGTGWVRLVVYNKIIKTLTTTRLTILKTT